MYLFLGSVWHLVFRIHDGLYFQVLCRLRVKTRKRVHWFLARCYAWTHTFFYGDYAFYTLRVIYTVLRVKRVTTQYLSKSLIFDSYRLRVLRKKLRVTRKTLNPHTRMCGLIARKILFTRSRDFTRTIHFLLSEIHETLFDKTKRQEIHVWKYL